jgi:GNAT superfamily N-acetyltransferase
MEDPTRLLQQQFFGAGGGAIASDSGRGGECMWAAAGRLSRRVRACRPGRRVHGWGAVARAEGTPGKAPAEPDPQAGLAGVILLLELPPSGQGSPRFSIPWLLVRPVSRLLGVGRGLVAAALGYSRGLGARSVTIDTLDRWAEAVAFWRGVGFFRC